MARLKAKDSNYSSDYSIKTLRLLIMDCLDGHIESYELGNWAYEAWHVQSEKKADSKFLDFLMDISSEWGLMSQTNSEFSRNFLHLVLAKVEDFLNIGADEAFEDQNL